MKKNWTVPLLTIAFISTHVSLTGQVCMPCEINSSWQHTKAIVIDNSTNPTSLNNYQVLLTLDTQTPIGLGEMNADGSDIRFTTECTDDLFYWIEDGINTPTTHIWLKLPFVPANSIDTVYMYYGNLIAPMVSNPDSTFDLYDDFNGSSLDLTKWELRGSPTYTVSGGELTFTGNGNWEYMRSYANFSQPVVIEETHSNAGPSFGLVLGYTGTDSRYTFRENGGQLGCTEDPDVSGGNAWFNVSYPSVPYPPNPTYYDYSVIAGMNGSAIQVQQYCNTSTANCNLTVVDLNSFSGSSFYIGYSSYSVGYTGYASSIRVRKYSAIVPSATLQNISVSPTVDLGPDTTICSNTSIILDAGNLGATYLWNDLSTNQTISASLAGAYIVTVTDSNSCSNSDTVNVSNVAPPSVNLGSDTMICNGNTLLLDAENPGADYLWSNSLTTQTISVSATGYYGVGVTDTFGCENTDTIYVDVFTIDNGTTTNSLTITADAVFATYQWIDCNNSNQPIAGETGMSYTATINGSYAVIIDQMGCTDTSNCVTINSVGLDANNAATFHIYPNPTSGNIFIEVASEGQYQITNMLGEVISSHQLYTSAPNYINLQHLLPGVYFIYETGSNALTGKQKIVIRR